MASTHFRVSIDRWVVSPMVGKGMRPHCAFVNLGIHEFIIIIIVGSFTIETHKRRA